MMHSKRDSKREMNKMMKGFRKETSVPKSMSRKMTKLDKAAKKSGF